MRDMMRVLTLLEEAEADLVAFQSAAREATNWERVRRVRSAKRHVRRAKERVAGRL